MIAKASAAPLPTLHCIGKPTVTDSGETKSGLYWVEFHLEADYGGRSADFRVFINPAWLRDGQPSEERSDQFLYGKYVRSADRTGFLENLYGDAYEEVARRLMSLAETEENDSSGVALVLSEALDQYDIERIGYTLKQRRVRTNENGTWKTYRTSQYEVASLWQPTEERIERLAKSTKAVCTWVG